jgi:phospholipid-binding lipoprotein MlaA
MLREFPLRRSDLQYRPVARPDSIFRVLIFSLCLILCGGCATTKKPTAEKNAIPGIEADKPGPYEQLDVNEPTVIAYEDYQDPLESFNRAMFKFNDVSYRYFLSPLAKGYRKIAPGRAGGHWQKSIAPEH